MRRRDFFLLLPFLALGCVQKDPEELRRLTLNLSSSDPKIRNRSALKIAAFGRAGQKAVPALIKVLRTDSSRGIRSSAAYALRAIGTPEAVSALDQYEE